jgi:hypothetical protein
MTTRRNLRPPTKPISFRVTIPVWEKLNKKSKVNGIGMAELLRMGAVMIVNSKEIKFKS